MRTDITDLGAQNILDFQIMDVGTERIDLGTQVVYWGAPNNGVRCPHRLGAQIDGLGAKSFIQAPTS